MLEPAQVRIGDAERQQAAALLGDHFAAGRLDVQEYDARVARAYAARTSGDLRPLFLDLPVPQQPPARRSAPVGLPAVAVRLLLLLFVVLFTVRAGFPPLFLIPLWWFWAGGSRRPRPGRRPAL